VKTERAGVSGSISIRALSELLRSIIQSPAEFANDGSLKAALKSQGSLAKFERTGDSIVPSSINTLKKWSAEYLDGGWEGLDHLRKSAVDALLQHAQKTQRSNKTTKDGLRRRASELEEKLEELREVNLGLLSAIGTLCADIRNVANLKDAKDRNDLASESLGRLRATIALNDPPFDRFSSGGSASEYGSRRS
jgi:hypothetical protein